MLAGLLASARVPALVEDAAISSLNPLLQSAVGGAKVLVPEGDEARAREILGASGIFPGEGGDGGEAPEEEWGPEIAGAAPEPAEPEAEAPSLRALSAGVVGFLLAPTLVAPLFAVWLALRALRTTGRPSRRAKVRLAAALALDGAALLLAAALFATVLSPPAAVEAEPGPHPSAPREPRPLPHDPR